MYDLFYDWLIEHIFNNDYLSNTSFDMFGSDITLQAWLCHSVCIVCAILFVCVVLWFVKYLFRYFGSLFRH